MALSIIADVRRRGVSAWAPVLVLVGRKGGGGGALPGRTWSRREADPAAGPGAGMQEDLRPAGGSGEQFLATQSKKVVRVSRSPKRG